MLRCGLLGRTLCHSYSPAIHAAFGGYDYRLYEKEPDELAAFLRDGAWDGLNVTIPYKKAVLPLCDTLSDTARRIGSVNTLVRRPDGTIYGDNTDAYGFACQLRTTGFDPRGQKALVFGSGGASCAVCDVLHQAGAQVVVISRSGADNYDNLSRHADAALLVNTTPLGMYPNNGQSPVDLAHFPRCACVLDVVYNPARTALLLQAEARGIAHAGGLVMLVAQAARSSACFTGLAVPEQTQQRVLAQLSRQMQNIILVGMPGCGKSTIGALLAKQLGREFVDADAQIAQKAGMSIPEIFARYGEAHFRALETDVLAGLGARSGLVIATGGGSVTREENYLPLHQNGTIIWLRRELTALPSDGRPLSLGADLSAMYQTRAPLYARFADLQVENDGLPQQTVDQILEVLS